MVLVPDHMAGAGVLRLHKRIPGVEDYFVLVRGITTIGRHPGNNISIPKSSISRHHAKIERSGENYSVEDLGSSNGTFVNGQPVRFLEIKNRDTITFGDVEFTFFLDEETTPRQGTRADSTQVHLRINGDSVKSEVVQTQSVVDAEKAFSEIMEIHSVSQAIKYLRTHYRLLDTIRHRPSEEHLMENFLEILFDVIRADRGVIMLAKEDSEENLEPAAVHVRDGDAPHEVSISQTITSRCIKEQVAILSSDVMSDARFSESESILARPVRSAICVPLLLRNRLLGVCYLDTQKGIEAFDEADLRFVTNLSAQLALALDNLRMSRERQQAEQLSIIGQTMTEIAHNIKNVLLVTKGGIEMMERNLEDGNLEYIRETWDLVRRGMDRMNRMAVNMLSYARVDDRKRSEVHVHEVIDEAVSQIRPQLEVKGQHIEFAPGPGNDACWLDSAGLYDALSNILINASEAIAGNPEGKICVRTEPCDDQLHISIEDNGEGIPPGEIERICLPFYTTKDQGTGMGLAMAKRFVTEMNGILDIQSEPGAGTTVKLSFPVPPKQDEEDSPVAREA